MIETLRPRTSRPRPTLARLMFWIAGIAVVLSLVASMVRLRPYWLPHGGSVHLGILCALLYLPVLPALLVWQICVPRHRAERHGRVVVFLVLCFLGWLGAIALTFRSLLSSIGL